MLAEPPVRRSLWDTRASSANVATGGSRGESKLYYAAWHPDGDTFAVSKRNNQIEFYDQRRSRPLRQRTMDDSIYQMAWDRAGDVLFVTTAQGDVLVYEEPDLQLGQTIRAHTGRCFCLSID